MTADGVTLWALFAAGISAAALFVASRQLYFGLVAPALLYLSLDELADLHERIGKWLEPRTQVPGIQDADSIVLFAYGLALTVLAVRHRAELTSAPGAGPALTGAFALGGLAVAMDALVPHGTPGAHVEEYLESAAAVLMAAVFTAHLRAAFVRWSEGWRETGSARLTGNVPPVLDDVTHSHALDHESQRTGNPAR